VAAIHPVGLGRHLTHLVVTMQAVNLANGTLSDSTPVATLVSSTGTINIDLIHTANLSDDVEFVIRKNLEAIQSITRNRVHMVPTTIGASITLAELVRKGTDVAQLAACWFEGPSRYAKIDYYRMGHGYTVYMRMRSFRMNPQRTRNVDVAEFVLIDAATAPAFAAGMRPA